MSEYTEQWLQEYQQRTQKHTQLAAQGKKTAKHIQPPTPEQTNAPQGKQAQKKRVVIVLPFKLPTWNALLSMNRFQRAKERHRIHNAVLAYIASAGGLPTLMEFQEKH